MAPVSDTIFSLLLIASGVLGATTLGFAVAWVRARERAGVERASIARPARATTPV